MAVTSGNLIRHYHAFSHHNKGRPIVHQIRNSIKYLASKHHKAFMAALKPVYRAVSKGDSSPVNTSDTTLTMPHL
ncbi:hypothetical protein UP57_004801 [Salmonella enterica subsp. enterica serovar Hermannswerder]|uniref:Uncharacterized protein n=1 Tax=Salmonella enterica subsp. salamae TaxID=59202 RepID=I3W435_SALER|nr:hypothetical protein [Salmonella enterica subsp. salamae]EAB7505469.1 hypothetical protein [Salmonella enterica subsp. enterica]EAR7456923.1 hypothetical protein [Salmonella enterica]EBQ9894310.1 hypothetical protein [Salmonella enterica subsp. enterica serovar Hvittingfoss]EBS2857925.1 hypothetical protein [Salmonella enterica subsp. enterica serovar Richmond]EBW4542114.1 hypothetical protein [Salmonella enterica subsp. enterica serovar Abony]EBZ4061964.1 hypothetical protein [Salmonella 